VLEDYTSPAGGSVIFFLADLPTLLYFSSFSCFITFWIWLYFQEKRKIVIYSFIAFNAFLYLVFLIVIILFRTLPNEGTKSECENLLPTESDNTNYQILVIFYQSFMAGVSILLALASIGAGSKFYIW